MHIEPSETAFADRYRRAEPQVVWTTLVADLETPVSAFLKLGGGKAMSFLLESVEGGAVRGRYSIIGFDPDLIWRTNDGKAEITIPQPAPQSEMPSTDNRATDDRHSSIAPPVHESEAPVWTRCIVNLIPSGQIAVWTATSYQACISAGTKCAGSRRYANIQFFPQPYLSASSPEQCSTAP